MKYFMRSMVLALLALTCLQAQDITKGSIVGVVRDASGAVVPGATVKLTSPYGDRTTTTNSEGAYNFSNLTAGTDYSVSVEQAGFSTARAEKLTVGTNRTATYDFALEVGSAAQSVEVTAEAGAAIDMSSTTVGANL